MTTIRGKYKKFSTRLIDTMKMNGYGVSRSPHGICMKTLAEFAGASEQICRRYIRGDALPDYDKIINIAENLNVSPGWLLFGEQQSNMSNLFGRTDDALIQYILTQSHMLFRDDPDATDDYADFVIGLIKEVREIDAPKESLEKIINLALSSISSYKNKRNNKNFA